MYTLSTGQYVCFICVCVYMYIYLSMIYIYIYICMCIYISPGQVKRPGFDPWVRKMPWSRKFQPIPVFLPGKVPGQRTVHGVSESDTTKWPEHTHTIPGQDTVFPVSSYLSSVHALPLLFWYLRDVLNIFSSHLANVWWTYFFQVKHIMLCTRWTL